jgi:hypothetical protein
MKRARFVKKVNNGGDRFPIMSQLANRSSCAPQLEKKGLCCSLYFLGVADSSDLPNPNAPMNSQGKEKWEEIGMIRARNSAYANLIARPG